jgi:hypothetical protein
MLRIILSIERIKCIRAAGKLSAYTWNVLVLTLFGPSKILRIAANDFQQEVVGDVAQ